MILTIRSDQFKGGGSAGGGKINRETVKDFKSRGTDPIEVVTDKDTHGADQLVIAAGAWSGRLAAKLGARVALVAERGYNVVLPDPGVQTHIPMVLMDIRVATTPLPNGLRMTTVAEYNDVDAPPDNRRAEKLFKLARGYLPGLDLGGAKWGMGARPSTPDSLPVIARPTQQPTSHPDVRSRPLRDGAGSADWSNRRRPRPRAEASHRPYAVSTQPALLLNHIPDASMEAA